MIHKINSFLLLVTILTITACEKEFLETKPTNSISAADALANSANLKLVLNGLHRQMFAQSPIPGGSSSRAGEHYWIPLDDVITGDLIHSAPANGWMRSDLRWLAHTDETTLTVQQLWYQRYHFIASSNSIINKIAELGLSTDDPDIRNILGQAYAYRAWSYYRLVTHYAKGYLVGNPSTDPGVPLLLSTEAPYESAPRSTVQEIYDQMEADINTSIDFFNGATTIASDKSQISLEAAHGIKARIALSKGDWATASSSAIAARANFPLMGENDWLSGFNTVNLSEVIWGGILISTETTYYRSYFYLICPTFNGSQNRGNPKLFNIQRYNEIPATDFRRNAVLPLAPNTNGSANNDQGGSYTVDPNYSDAESFAAAKAEIISRYGMTSRHNTHPYMHVKFLQENPGTIDPDDVIYMRSSEMYLIEAEAKTMLGDLDGARAILQTFGSSRDSAYSSAAYTTQQQLMDHIKFQRYVELFGEGFSYTDHIRWDEPIDLTGSGASEVYYQDGFRQAAPSVNDDWIWKIPRAEIDANPYISPSDQN